MKKSLFGVSMLTITCLYGILAGVIILVTIVAGGNVLYAVLGSLIVLIIQFLISPWLTDLSMKWFYKAKFGGEIPDYLKKFTKETQFLVITHRKGTMEAADTVYGITMEENGISKLLSMKLK